MLVVRSDWLVFLGVFGDERQSWNASSWFSPELEETGLQTYIIISYISKTTYIFIKTN